MSLISGIIAQDLLIGGTILLTGLLCAYFASEGKRINYILGLVNYLLMGYVAFKKNLDNEKNVKVREFNLKNSIIITLSCVIGSFVLGYLLSLIPGQRLALMDATSNCINLCGVILMILRFKESWWIWLTNNIIDLIIWIITVIEKGNGSMMMLLVSAGYLLINIYGIIKWNIEAKKNN